MDAKNFMFSASSFKDYMQCGLKFKFAKIDKAPPTETATHHRWFGSLVHAMIYHSVADYDGSGKNLVMRKKSRKKATLKLFEDIWDGKATDNNAEIILKSIGEKPTGKFATGKIASLGATKADMEQAVLEQGWREEARKMIENGVDVLSGVHEIVELEKKMFYRVHGYSFIGFVDVLAKNKDGLYEFYDFKTSWDKSYDLQNDFQFFAYSKAVSEDKGLGIDESYYPKGYWVHLRKGELLEFSMDKKKFWQMMDMTKYAIKNIEDDIFLPDYGGPLCKYCDYRHICYGQDDKVWGK